MTGNPKNWCIATLGLKPLVFRSVLGLEVSVLLYSSPMGCVKMIKKDPFNVYCNFCLADSLQSPFFAEFFSRFFSPKVMKVAWVDVSPFEGPEVHGVRWSNPCGNFRCYLPGYL